MSSSPVAIAVGEVIHVVTRRAFETEPRRHFAGRVVAAVDLNVRVAGYSFVFDMSTSEMYVKQREHRTRIFHLGDSGLIVNVLPPDACVEDIHYGLAHDGRLVVADGKTFSLSVQEFGIRR